MMWRCAHEHQTEEMVSAKIGGVRPPMGIEGRQAWRTGENRSEGEGGEGREGVEGVAGAMAGERWRG